MRIHVGQAAHADAQAATARMGLVDNAEQSPEAVEGQRGTRVLRHRQHQRDQTHREVVECLRGEKERV